jgi:hypothetical protein
MIKKWRFRTLDTVCFLLSAHLYLRYIKRNIHSIEQILWKLGWIETLLGVLRSSNTTRFWSRVWKVSLEISHPCMNSVLDKFQSMSPIFFIALLRVFWCCCLLRIWWRFAGCIVRRCIKRPEQPFSSLDLDRRITVILDDVKVVALRSDQTREENNASTSCTSPALIGLQCGCLNCLAFWRPSWGWEMIRVRPDSGPEQAQIPQCHLKCDLKNAKKRRW